LTSKETELWHSLGDAWLLTRDQWNGYVEPYQPIFMDGWSPTIPESNLSESVAKEAQIRAQELRAKQEAANAQRIGSREPSVSPVEMVRDDFATGQRAFMDSVLSKGGRLVVVTHPRTANNQKELTVVRGEYLEVLDDTKKWWKARNWKSQVAHVPHTIVSELSQDSSASYHNENGRSGRRFY
jgi:epidermal growth factor receptor kinase substrate 8